MEQRLLEIGLISHGFDKVVSFTMAVPHDYHVFHLPTFDQLQRNFLLCERLRYLLILILDHHRGYLFPLHHHIFTLARNLKYNSN